MTLNIRTAKMSLTRIAHIYGSQWYFRLESQIPSHPRTDNNQSAGFLLEYTANWLLKTLQRTRIICRLMHKWNAAAKRWYRHRGCIFRTFNRTRTYLTNRWQTGTIINFSDLTDVFPFSSTITIHSPGPVVFDSPTVLNCLQMSL